MASPHKFGKKVLGEVFAYPRYNESALKNSLNRGLPKQMFFSPIDNTANFFVKGSYPGNHFVYGNDAFVFTNLRLFLPEFVFCNKFLYSLGNYHTNMLLSFSPNVSIAIAPVSPFPRSRTLTVLLLISLSPTIRR